MVVLIEASNCVFYIFSKIFWFIAEPIALAVLVGILGVILGFTRFAQVGRVLTAGAIFALAAFLLTPLGALLLRPLEDRFPQPPAEMIAPTGIIVLGGASDAEKSEARGQVYLNSDAARMTAGIELVRRYPAARLVFSGGSEAISAKALALAGRAWRAHDLRRQISQYMGKCCVHSRSRQAEERRGVASRDLGLAHAAFGRNIPAYWF
jgi:uncharacterized SAM-binding protein YcdF (DUF218 family)